jgi:hypothetical protein
MNMNLMTFLVGKVVAEKLGEQRSTQLGLVAGMMPGFQGVLMSALIAQREEPASSTKPVDPKTAEQQAAMLKRLQDVFAPSAPAIAK